MYIAFSIVRGANEEHFYYFVAAPAIIGTTVAAALAVRRDPAMSARPRRAFVAVLATGAVLLGVWDVQIWTTVRTKADDGYVRVARYLERQPYTGERRMIAVDGSTAAMFVLGGPDVVGPWHTRAELREHRVEYVLVSSRLVADGYSEQTPKFVAWLKATATPVLKFRGPTTGILTLYRLGP